MRVTPSVVRSPIAGTITNIAYENSPLEIREWINNSAGEGVQLSGRGKPIGELNAGVRTIKKITRYPGESSSTAQVLGWDEEPTSLVGRWRTVDLYSTDAAMYLDRLSIFGDRIVEIEKLIKTVEDLVQGGALLQVTWNNVIRYGFMDFEYSFGGAGVCTWKMSFEWTGREESISRISTATPTIESTYQSWTDLVDGFVAIATYPAKMISSVIDTVNTVVADISSSVDNITAGLAEYSNLEDQISDTTQSIKNVAANIANMSNQTTIALHQAYVDERSLYYQSEGVSGVFNETDVLLGEIAMMERRAYHRDVAVEAIAIKKFMDSQSFDDLLAVVNGVSGMTLMSLAQEYYGDPTKWELIWEYNEGLITNPRDVDGLMIYIPVDNA